jgi:exopolysaccharide production protein ExoQ
MTSFPRPVDRADEPRGINICPNVVLALAVLTSLVFVSYLGRNGVLIFLTTGLFLLVRRIDLTLRALQDYWWLFLLPLWATLSAIWSEHPDLSLRHGLQLLITFMIAVILASRLAPSIFLRVQFAALVLAGLASVLIGDVRADGVWIGIFESKNYYAFTMVALLLSSFALLADWAQSAFWRLAGLGGAVLAMPQIALAESVGAIVASIFVLIAALVLLNLSGLPPARQRTRVMMMGGSLLCLLAVSFQYRDAITGLIFQTTGKDPSLTGRTELWETAVREVAQSPILGIGYRAFWVEGNALAEALWADFYIASKSGFNFHNLILSNAVEIGVVGVLLQFLLIMPAFVLASRWLLTVGHAPSMFGFMAISFVIILSVMEVPVFFEFHALSVMVLVALVYGLRAARTTHQIRKLNYSTAPEFLPRYSRAAR